MLEIPSQEGLMLMSMLNMHAWGFFVLVFARGFRKERALGLMFIYPRETNILIKEMEEAFTVWLDLLYTLAQHGSDASYDPTSPYPNFVIIG